MIRVIHFFILAQISDCIHCSALALFITIYLGELSLWEHTELPVHSCMYCVMQMHYILCNLSTVGRHLSFLVFCYQTVLGWLTLIYCKIEIAVLFCWNSGGKWTGNSSHSWARLKVLLKNYVAITKLVVLNLNFFTSKMEVIFTLIDYENEDYVCELFGALKTTTNKIILFWN